MSSPEGAGTAAEDRYERQEEIARGGMGRVLVAFDRRLGREVAIKEVLRSGDELTQARFWRESLMTARLQHPGIVPVYEIGRRESGEPFLTMRRVEGEPLEVLINAADSPDARLRLLPNVLAAIDAVSYAHEKRIIHRDLKPSNILVGRFGETVVIDWGIAKSLDAAQTPPEVETPPVETKDTDPDSQMALTVEGTILGTPSHMPPEQAAGKPSDARSDVYSLGAVLYQLLSGKPPYQGTSARAILLRVLSGEPEPLEKLAPWVPRDLISIIKRAMARDPAQRFPSARELGEELRGFLSGRLVSSHRYTWPQRVSRWSKRNAAAVSIGALAILILGALAIVSVRRILLERQAADAARVLAEGREQELAIERSRLLMETDPLAALEGLEQLSLDRPGWGDARLLAEEIRDRGLPAWRIEMPDWVMLEQISPISLLVTDGQDRVWWLDSTTGALQPVANMARGELRAASDESAQIVTDENGVLRSYTADTGEQIGVDSKRRGGAFAGPSSAYQEVWQLENGRLVTSVANEGILRLDLQRGSEEVLVSEPRIDDLSVSRDGSRIVYTVDGLPWIWEERTGRRKLPKAAREALQLSPDGKAVAWLDAGRARFEQLDLHRLGESGLTPIDSLGFNRDGSLLAFAGEDGVELVDLRRPEAAARRFPLGRTARVSFDAADRNLLALGADSISVVELASGAVARKLRCPGVERAWLLGDWLIARTADALLGFPARLPYTAAPLGGDRLLWFAALARGEHWLTATGQTGNRGPVLRLWNAGSGENRLVPSNLPSPGGDVLVWQTGDALHFESLVERAPREHPIAGGNKLLAVSDGPGALLQGERRSFVYSAETDRESPVQLPDGVQLVRARGCGKLRFVGIGSDDKARAIDGRTGEARELGPWSHDGAISCVPDSSAFALRSEGAHPLRGDLDHPGPLVPFAELDAAGAAYFGPHGVRALLEDDSVLHLARPGSPFNSIPFNPAPARIEGGFSQDGSRLCLVDTGGSLWLVPVDGHTPRRLGEDLARRRADEGPRVFVGCGFTPRGDVVAALGDSTLLTFPDDLPTDPPALLASLRAMVKMSSVPRNPSVDGVAHEKLAEGLRLVQRGQVKQATARLYEALAAHPSRELEGKLHRDLGVVEARQGNSKAAAEQLRLYLPFARPEERKKVQALIEKFQPEHG